MWFERCFLCGTGEIEQRDRDWRYAKRGKCPNALGRVRGGHLTLFSSCSRSCSTCSKRSRLTCVKSLLFQFMFPPETTACPALITEVSPERAVRSPNYISRLGEPSPSHKASKLVHSTTTMDSHTQQAICFNYVDHFILFADISREPLWSDRGEEEWSRTRGAEGS